MELLQIQAIITRFECEVLSAINYRASFKILEIPASNELTLIFFVENIEIILFTGVNYKASRHLSDRSAVVFFAFTILT
jgi:hypothetical protein